ncbi:hypothetical protein Ciccas_010470 [Cichlidogyrus casuarinus]|uniref:Uncharacterized protein n=1 Tax=Cichlidogyrus casuarinus TaxID=1844966 RepID=A0ABD2PU45_9PLAT
MNVIASNGYKSRIKGNVIVLKDMKGMGFQHGVKYGIEVRAVYNEDDSKELGSSTFTFNESVYSQEIMDNMAQDIANKLNASMETNQRNLSRELSEISQPWSYTVDTLILIISNDANAFAGKEGLKESNFFPEKPCNSTTKCRSVILKEGMKKNYVFTWPDENEQVRCMSAQLRFYYGKETHSWYATKVYPIGSSSHRISGCQSLSISQGSLQILWQISVRFLSSSCHICPIPRASLIRSRIQIICVEAGIAGAPRRFSNSRRSADDLNLLRQKKPLHLGPSSRPDNDSEFMFLRIMEDSPGDSYSTVSGTHCSCHNDLPQIQKKCRLSINKHLSVFSGH